ncbi:MAG TPA: DUF3047 domain-containing protein [Nitrospirota bacterium]|nr:DUF3047 domain-containing protein [Nitrospirota bacterium]
MLIPLKRWPLKAVILILFLLAAVPLICLAGERTVLFHEDFQTLDNWRPFYFPKIEKHSVYSIVHQDGRTVLKAESNASASAMVFKESYSVYEYPMVRWRWKVDNVYAKGLSGVKAGDDYPMRVYIMFEYDPEQAGAFERLEYGIAKKIYGYYPPQSSINYVWANKEEGERIVTSPYTDRAKMVLLQRGKKNVGVWQDELVDVLADYEKAFGTKPPVRARIAIMNDSDNTGEQSVSYMEFIEVFR